MFHMDDLNKDSKLKNMEKEDLIYVYQKIQAVKDEQNKEEKKKQEEVKRVKHNIN